MTIFEIIIAELHCLSNCGHRVDCSASCVHDGSGCTKNRENAYHGPAQGTKNIPRPNRTDVVPGRSSTRNGSGTISNHNSDILTNNILKTEYFFEYLLPPQWPF